MTNRLAALALPVLALVILSVAGCGGGAEETPAEALQAIIRLYEAEDYDALIRTRYAEIGKTNNEQQVQSLIDRLATTFADPTELDRALTTYRSALSVEPRYSEDGTVAIFELGHASLRLSRMPGGKWGFNL